MGQLKLLAMPEQLYAEIPSYGMTGTLEGATQAQLKAMLNVMSDMGLPFEDSFYWHFGDAIGADEDAFIAVSNEYPFQVITVAHPGLNLKGKQRAFCKATVIREPMENLARNARIAYCAHLGLFALPRTQSEILRSGTWATIRTAGKLKRPTFIITPDGKVGEYPEGYVTVLRRDLIEHDEIGAWGL
jgi:hypothetical protein